MDVDRVNAYLAEADRSLADDRLLSPAGDDAYSAYLVVLALVADHPEALRGLELIVERYLALTRRAIAREEWARARSMLDSASIVDPHNVDVAAMRSQIEMLSTAERHQLDLQTRAVRERRDDVAAELAAFGRHARSTRARVLIRAGSDEEGRWMYAQLNKAAGERRIRGEIEIGRPPRVLVWVLPSASAE